MVLTHEMPQTAPLMFNLAGKTALITGAARGLGLGYAQGLAAAGARVILSDVNHEQLREAVAGFQQQGIGCHGYRLDVTDDANVRQTIELIEEEIGPIDILVNNAGINLRAPLEECPEETWQAVIEVNLNGVWRVSKYVARGMIRRQRGKIINIASLMSFAGRPTTGPYTASKGGVAMLTKAMAVEWAQHNLQCNAVAPGYFATEMTRPLVENEEFDHWVKLRTPARRWGNPNELLGALIFLASSASSFISGQVLYVDGGWTANL